MFSLPLLSRKAHHLLPQGPAHWQHSERMVLDVPVFYLVAHVAHNKKELQVKYVVNKEWKCKRIH